MNVNNFKSNSHVSREEQRELSEKKVQKVISGSAKAKKKTGFQKFTDVFISDDVDNVKSYIFEDIVVPTIKDIILDVIKALLGASGRSDKSSTASRTSYKNYYDRNDDRRDRSSTKTRTGYSYDDIVLDNRGEAEEVLSKMDELISTYGLVSVADLYDLVGITGNYTDNKYGWTDIRSAQVIRVRDGHLLKLPRALSLN